MNPSVSAAPFTISFAALCNISTSSLIGVFCEVDKAPGRAFVEQREAAGARGGRGRGREGRGGVSRLFVHVDVKQPPDQPKQSQNDSVGGHGPLRCALKSTICHPERPSAHGAHASNTFHLGVPRRGVRSSQARQRHDYPNKTRNYIRYLVRTGILF